MLKLWSGSALLLSFISLSACTAELAENPTDDGGSTSGGAAGSPSTPKGGAPSAGASQGQGGSSGTSNVGGTTAGGTAATGGSAGSSNGVGGTSAAGGTAGRGGGGGTSGKGGAASSGGSAGAAGSVATGSACTQWPTATGAQNVSSTIKVSGTYDGAFKRFVGSGALGSDSQDEGQDALFDIEVGGTLKNVIIGAPAADGVHCKGACTLENVWWEDVGEDAATFNGTSNSQQMSVRCGGAKGASDKVLQHNGAGTLTVQDFSVETFGKLYRSCGNCENQYARHVVFKGITAKGGGVLAGVNTNYGDSAEFENITIFGKVGICDRYTGNDSGAEPSKTGSGADSTYCKYTTADITQK